MTVRLATATFLEEVANPEGGLPYEVIDSCRVVVPVCLFLRIDTRIGDIPAGMLDNIVQKGIKGSKQAAAAEEDEEEM